MLSVAATASTWGPDTCSLNQECIFSILTTNNSEIVNQSICNITIYNSTFSHFLNSTMQNNSIGLQNFTQVFNQTGTFYVIAQCLFQGITYHRVAEVEVMPTSLTFNWGSVFILELLGFFFIAMAFYLIRSENEKDEREHAWFHQSFFGMFDFTIDNGIALLLLALGFGFIRDGIMLLVIIADIEGSAVFMAFFAGIKRVLDAIDLIFWIFLLIFIITWIIDRFIYPVFPRVNEESGKEK